MEDQPVPNPMASNANFNTHKVFAAIGLVLIAATIILGGLWWYVNKDNTGSVLEDNGSNKVTTSSANTSEITATGSAQ